MPRAARIAVALCAARLAAGCASMQEAQLDPAARARLGAGPTIHVVHWGPKPLGAMDPVHRLDRVPAPEQDDLYGVPGVEDPVADIEAAFVAALREELGLTNLRPAGRPRWESKRMLPRGVSLERASANGPPLIALPAEWFPDGLLLELETLYWQLEVSGGITGTWSRVTGTPKCTLRFGHRARLVRLSDDQVLWRGFCEAKHPRPCDDFKAGDYALVRTLRGEIAKRCAAELMGSFMGRTETTFVGGLNQPKEPPR